MFLVVGFSLLYLALSAGYWIRGKASFKKDFEKFKEKGASNEI
jgi:hypothetical protein